MTMFWWMLVGHALCDYPLQGDFLARGKNHKNPIHGIPFYQCLFAHALIHAGAVSAITGSVVLGVAEFIAHVVIDFGKCDGRYGLNVDQALHFGCKVAWAIIAGIPR